MRDEKAFQNALLELGAQDDFSAWNLDEGNLRFLIGRYEVAKAAKQPDDISDEEESAWQIINSELAKLNLIGKARTDAADAIWEKIMPFIHEAVDVEKIARMTCEPAWEKLSPEVQQHKLELARDAIAAMGFTLIYTKRESGELIEALSKGCYMFSEAAGTYNTYKLVLGFPDIKTMQQAQRAIVDALPKNTEIEGEK